MANKENLPPSPGFVLPIVHALSPSSKPNLSRQRDHSTCRRPDTPLKVRKTRENLRDPYSIPLPACSHGSLACAPPYYGGTDCSHNNNNESSESSLLTPPLGYATDDGTWQNYAPEVQRMQRHTSVSRRMLSRVKQGIQKRSQSSQGIRPVESETNLLRKLSGKRKQSSEIDRRAQSFEITRDSIDGSVQIPLGTSTTVVAPSRSLTPSTISTREILGDSVTSAPPSLDLRSVSASEAVPSLSPTSFRTTPEAATPRATRREAVATPSEIICAELHVPHVELCINVDVSAIDAGGERDVWVAIRATTRSNKAPDFGANDKRVFADQLGQIQSLKICLKPVSQCRTLEVIGQKAFEDLMLGQQCSLFVKLHIPPVVPATQSSSASSAALFTELESMVGTLETDILYAEVRYHHSLLPPDNVITVRKAAKVRRPRIQSRWSLTETAGNETSPTAVHLELASYIASQYHPERALRLLDHCLGQVDTIRDIRQTLLDGVRLQEDSAAECRQDRPAVIITDIDCNISSLGMTDASSLLPRSIAERKTSCGHSHDDARKVWRHIRHSSLSAQQLANLTSDTLQHLEDSSEVLRDLRRQAIANKRSVGAETLRAWRWEEKTGYGAVAPWM